MQEDKLSKQLEKTLRAGNDVFEIETICQFEKKAFFTHVYNVQKIKERKYQSNFTQLLKEVLVKISVLAGIRNQIDEVTKIDIFKMLKYHYDNLAIEELYKAFELERFGVFENKTEHYQLFDSNYISDVLKKYVDWKIQQKKILNFQTVVKLSEITELEKINILKNQIQNRYEEFLKTNNVAEKKDHYFDFLVEQNKIVVNNSQKNKDWFAVRYKVAQDLLFEEYNSKKSISKEENIKIKNILNLIQNKNSDLVLIKAKEIILLEFFEKQANNWITNIF